MLLIRFLLLGLALLFSIAVQAARPEYLEGRLDNGLVYHIFNVPSAGRQLVLRLQVNVGAADEEDGEEGIAHITEHMVFQSSEAFPKGLSSHLSTDGWQMGRHFNAQTGYRYTRYLLIPPKGRKQLDEALAVYKQILSPQTFSERDWAKEQQVIFAEWRQQQTLQDRLNRQYDALLHQGARSARYAPIGRLAAIKQAKTDTANRFHHKWYGSNNAVLVVIGDLNLKKTAAAIEEALGRLNPVVLPQRNPAEYEPKLSTGEHKSYVKDKDNAESKLALVYRFDNALSQSNDLQGYYHRLLDNFAAYMLHQRIQASGEPVSMKAGNIGSHTGSLSLHTEPVPGDYEAGLALLKNLVETIKQQPVTAEETAAYRKTLYNHLLAASDLPDDLIATVKLAEESVLAGYPAPTKEVRAAERSQLYRIDAAAVNKRISEWLTAADSLVIIQAPEGVPEKLPNPHLAEQPAVPKGQSSDKKAMPVLVENSVATPKTIQPSTQAFAFPIHNGTGRVVSESYDNDNKVTYLNLNNGDQVVLLQKDVAGGQVYFKAVSDIGYLQAGDTAWQAQLAGDVVSVSAPEGASDAVFKRWQRQHGIEYRYQLTHDSQITDARVAQAELVSLLQLYRQKQTAPTAKHWHDEVESAAVRLPIYLRSVPGRQELELELLRYGKPENRAQSSSDIRSLTAQDLIKQWRQLVSKPVRYYIVSNMPSEKIKPLLVQYLADIPRQDIVNSHRNLLKGTTLRRAAINDTHSTDINAWSWQPFYDWTPDTSEQIPLLVNLANARLKEALRRRSQSTYSVKFAAMPKQSYNRVESNLFFSTIPEKASEAWEQAQQILQSLPENITKAEADNLQRLFIEQEAKRQKDPKVWLERLAASHKHYGDARYLSRLPQLHRTIIQTRLRQTAKLLWSSQNARVLLVDPANP
ncbi:M16 family metallopeptidase [Neisseria montereyensis]|uniref:Insulinase family protein n=1 Tax=Neisseria montereyensis TaxID=2973938 RepID=A0ABT2FB89_9NEIS|nr:insulinase family protein [Neisseria montereyensis]MCS4533441.1 insulinase family protein [Neisseria montereyensis]